MIHFLLVLGSRRGEEGPLNWTFLTAFGFDQACVLRHPHIF